MSASILLVYVTRERVRVMSRRRGPKITRRVVVAFQSKLNTSSLALYRARHDASLGMTGLSGFSDELGMAACLSSRIELGWQCLGKHRVPRLAIVSQAKQLLARDDNVVEIEAKLPCVGLILWSSY